MNKGVIRPRSFRQDGSVSADGGSCSVTDGMDRGVGEGIVVTPSVAKDCVLEEAVAELPGRVQPVGKGDKVTEARIKRRDG